MPDKAIRFVRLARTCYQGEWPFLFVGSMDRILFDRIDLGAGVHHSWQGNEKSPTKYILLSGESQIWKAFVPPSGIFFLIVLCFQGFRDLWDDVPKMQVHLFLPWDASYLFRWTWGLSKGMIELVNHCYVISKAKKAAFGAIAHHFALNSMMTS